MAKASAKGKTRNSPARRRTPQRANSAKQAPMVEPPYELDEETDEEIEAAYRQLPLTTRKFIKSLTPQKIGKIERTIRAQEIADTFGWGAKWLFIAVVTIFGGIGTVIYGWNLLAEKLVSKATP